MSLGFWHDIGSFDIKKIAKHNSVFSVTFVQLFKNHLFFTKMLLGNLALI